jgi:hypothetical protein
MNILIDFVNTETWNPEALLDLHKKHGMYYTIEGQKKGYAESFFFEKFKGKNFCPNRDESSMRLSSDGPGWCVFPGDKEYEGLFDYLGTLQTEWNKRIKQTVKSGPETKFLNEIANRVKFVFESSQNPWDVKLSNFWNEQGTFESYIEFDYLKEFLAGQGEKFKRLRTCRECKNWFLYNRPKQISCSDKCRFAFGNRKKTPVEKAAYMKQKRDEGKYQ